MKNSKCRDCVHSYDIRYSEQHKRVVSKCRKYPLATDINPDLNMCGGYECKYPKFIQKLGKQ